jgi:nicotinate-nucleotide adenylyltransferase
VLGILGGTFDPIHYGHLELARETLNALYLAAVRLVPAGHPPHRVASVATPRQRLDMAELAIADYPGLAVDAREIDRPGPSYTVLTLEELRSENPARAQALIVGADAFLGLPTWHRWHELFELAHVIVVGRPGVAFEGMMPAPLVREWERRRTADPRALAKATAGVIIRQAITPQPISASAIRAALASGDDAAVRGLLPAAVLAYIERNRLYRSRPDAT